METLSLASHIKRKRRELKLLVIEVGKWIHQMIGDPIRLSDNLGETKVNAKTPSI